MGSWLMAILRMGRLCDMVGEQLAPRVLVAANNEGVAALIHSNLVNSGFDVTHAATGSQALVKSIELAPALIILDMLISDMSGKEVLRTLKTSPGTSGIPVIVVSDQSEEIDRIVALELGADDYVSKPFSPRELALRVRAILSRRPTQRPKPARMNVGKLRLDLENRSVSVNGKPALLSALDFRLITVLMEARGGVVSREQLIDAAWGSESEVSPRTVDTQLRRLRTKLGDAADQIQTVRGFGYRLGE
jgi:two-component system, OmpR family, phosphate regulon response regulator PhoB